MQREKIALHHFTPTTGYGYDDIGRDALDRVFAYALDAEDALVRPQFTSGTHAIFTALAGLLEPGDCMLSATGRRMTHWKRRSGFPETRMDPSGVWEFHMKRFHSRKRDASMWRL